MFLTLMVIGLVGLLVMALPAFGRHGGHTHGGGLRALQHAGAAVVPKGAAAHAGIALTQAADVGHAGAAPALVGRTRLMRLVPSPRAICSLLALFGAFGNVAINAFHLPRPWAALAAALPALTIERFGVTPLWNWMFRFQGRPASSLETLIFAEARAVSAFRNGRGIVSVAHDGRLVQLSARLVEGDATATVRLGARLRVEDVDAPNERVAVSVLRSE